MELINKAEVKKNRQPAHKKHHFQMAVYAGYVDRFDCLGHPHLSYNESRHPIFGP